MSDIRISVDARGVARLVLARAAKKNALSKEMMADLTEHARKLGRDPAVRVVVLEAEGEVFCAGGDLAWMQEQMAADDATRTREATRLARMLQALNELPKPLIGRVHGNAFGGGIGMMAVCDIAVVADSARFALSETRLGIIPATIGPYVINRMGEGRARRVFMSGKNFGAQDASDLGLAGRVVAGADLDKAIEDEVTPYLSCAPGAVAEAKRLARSLGREVDDAVIARTIEALIRQWNTDEAREGISAFFSKEKPSWMR